MRFSNLGAIALALCVVGCDRRSISVEKIDSSQRSFLGMSYFLPKGLVDLTISYKPGAAAGAAPVMALTVGAVSYVPDPEFHYQVNLNHDIFHDDELKVTVGKNGLLTGINSVTTDKTPEIIERLAKAPGEILGATPELAGGGPKPKFADIKFTLDPTDERDRARLNEHLTRLSHEGFFGEASIQFSARPVVTLPAMRGGREERPDCALDPCFRTAMPYALELWSNPSTEAEPVVVARTVAVLPNKFVVGQVALTRAPFVKKEFKLTFIDGMLTEADLKNPSEALAFIQIPIEVAKAIVAIPSAMLKFETKQITADNALLQAQQQNLQLQTQIIKAQNDLVSAQKSAASL